MPEKLKEDIIKSLMKAHPKWDRKKAESIAYATMVKRKLWKPKSMAERAMGK